MTWYQKSGERRRPPEEYAERLIELGGLNRFGEPNFILAWGETRTNLVYGTDAAGRRGQHTILQFGGVPAWHILAWKPPECYGTPEFWRAITWDSEAQLHGLGDFPWRGDYSPCRFNLYVRKVIGGGIRELPSGEIVEVPSKIKIDAMPLAHWVLELLIPNVIKELEVTYRQRLEAIRKRLAAERAEANQKAYDAYCNAAVAFGNAPGTHESNRERQMQRVAEKQQVSYEEVTARLGKGHRAR